MCDIWKAKIKLLGAPQNLIVLFHGKGLLLLFLLWWAYAYRVCIDTSNNVKITITFR